MDIKKVAMQIGSRSMYRKEDEKCWALSFNYLGIFVTRNEDLTSEVRDHVLWREMNCLRGFTWKNKWKLKLIKIYKPMVRPLVVVSQTTDLYWEIPQTLGMCKSGITVWVRLKIGGWLEIQPTTWLRHNCWEK